MPVLVSAPTISVDGAAIADALYDKVVDLRVEQTVSMPSSLTLRFSDPHFELVDATTFEVGKAIVVNFPNSAGAMMPVFDGEIVGVAIEQIIEVAEGCEFVVTAYDKSHRLGHKTTVRSFVQQKYTDVVRTIAGAHGLSANITESSPSVVHEYLLQTTNDYDTLNEIARLLGFQWHVDGSSLVFGPRATSTAVEVTYGESLRRLKVRFTGSERIGTATVRGWDQLTKQAIVSADTSAGTPAGLLGGGSVTIAQNGRTKAAPFRGERTASAMPVASTDEAMMLAKGISARAAASELYLRADADGNPAIKVGGTVEIKNAGTRVSGDYFVTSVEHVFGRSGDYVTRFTSGGLEATGLVDLLGAPAKQVPTFGNSGLAIGVVTNNNDPDGMGRVKVKLPALSDDVESWWARVLIVGAGADTGLYAMPQVNDEVLVGFEHGDVRRPFVLGGLYGGSVRPPTPNSEFVANNKIIQWNMKTGGHNMIFRSGDAPADQHVKLVTKETKATLYLGADKVELISSDKTVEIKNGNASILLAANGDITLRGNKITLQAQTDVAVNGTNVNTRATAGAKVEGATVEVKGSATAKLESGGITEVKGSMVKVN